jgi:DNA-binding XRE family transcriptional regulator
MIKNELQYRVKKAALKGFRETLAKHAELTRGQEAWVRELHRAQLKGEQLKAEIKEYEKTKSGSRPEPPLDMVAKIPDMLIQRRIALGWTQADLAKALGVKPQQVQADEANNYASANLARLMRTASVLKRARSKQPPRKRKPKSPENQVNRRKAAK